MSTNVVRLKLLTTLMWNPGWGKKENKARERKSNETSLRTKKSIPFVMVYVYY